MNATTDVAKVLLRLVSAAPTTESPVLLAFDESYYARAAVHSARRLFGARRQAIVLVVYGLPARFLSPRRPIASEKQATAIAARGVDEARRAGFVDVDRMVLGPEPERGREHERRRITIPQRIMQEATDCGAGVIVVGSRGRSGLGGAVLGSVSSGLLSRSRVPLLVVPRDANPDLCDGPPLLCYEGTDDHPIVVAGQLLGDFSRREAVVPYLWLPPSSSLGHFHPPPSLVVDPRVVAKDKASAVAEQGAKLARAAGFRDVTSLPLPEDYYLAHDLPHATHLGVVESLLKAADGYRSLAIVVGPRGLGMLSAVARVSVSWGLTHHHESRHPVLVVPHPEGYGFDIVRHYLDAKQSDWNVIEHHPVLGAAGEAEVSAVAPDETIAACLWRRTNEPVQSHPSYVMALVAATAKLDLTLLEEAAGSHLRQPTTAETQTDFPTFDLGALPPFTPLLNERSTSGVSVSVILDTQLAQARGPLLCSGGDHRHSVLVDPSALAEDAVVARISSA